MNPLRARTKMTNEGVVFVAVSIVLGMTLRYRQRWS